MKRGAINTKKQCPDCNGVGHDNKCKCRDAATFVAGCCENCGGNGYVKADPPMGHDPHNPNYPKIWIPDSS
jgi:DnaJ-class molecular chaperone